MTWTPHPSWLPQSTASELDEPTGSLAVALGAASDDAAHDTEPLPVSRTWKPDPAVVRAWQENSNTTETPTPAPEPEPASITRDRKLPRPMLLVIGCGACVATVAIAAGVMTLSGSDSKTPPIPTHVPTAAPVAAPAISTFCADRTEGKAITTAGPGDEKTGAGVIAALDHAYYTQRDAKRVSALMVKAPSSVPAIQAAIDAVPQGTKACVTAAPDTQPGAWIVDVRLQGPDHSERWLHQRITVSRVGEQFKVAQIEDRK